MKLVDVFILIFLLVSLAAGFYLLWIFFPSDSSEFEEYQANISEQFPSSSGQFYPRMRYVSRDISYGFTSKCGPKKKEDFKEAVARLETVSVLRFRESADSEISVTCSNISPDPDEEGHFVAGEGGPSIIINTSRYSVILKGEIALYRADSCEIPQIATHELLHALGFDHNSNKKSIMYPITGCEQEIDDYIISEINNLYKKNSYADLLIEKVRASKSGVYADFETTIGNQGLAKASGVKLKIYANGDLRHTFEIGEIDIGAKKTLTIENLRVPLSTEELELEVEISEPELSQANNRASVRLREVD